MVNIMKLTIEPYTLQLMKKALDAYIPEDDALEKEELIKTQEWITFLVENPE